MFDLIKVTKERDDLIDKTKKLDAFLVSKEYETVHPYERLLLVDQRSIMASYASVLTARIRLHTKEVDDD